MTKIEILKLATRFVVGAGTTTISKSIIDNNVASGGIYHRVTVAAASAVIGSMASEAVKSHTDAKIDHVVELWNKTKFHVTDTVTA